MHGICVLANIKIGDTFSKTCSVKAGCERLYQCLCVLVQTVISFSMFSPLFGLNGPPLFSPALLVMSLMSSS